jgi:RNA polymerase sigma-70 factor (ECF subfamily)
MVRTTHLPTLRTIGNFPAAPAQCITEVDDAALFARAAGGDERAFTTLFCRCQGPIYRYAAHMCGREAADDVVQETFLRVLRQSGRFDPAKGPVLNYLLGIARHVVFARLGGDQPLSGVPDADSVMDAESPTAIDTLTRAETIDMVRAAIASLPPVYREAVVLCELQEMSYEAAAGIVGCPVGTIRSRLHRARGLLMQKLAVAQPAAACRKVAR